MVNGTKQSVHIKTLPEDGAYCEVCNGRGQWVIYQTPSSLNIDRDDKPLHVKCIKRALMGETIIESQTHGSYWGNLLLIGGTIGMTIDHYNGSAYEYPENINVIFKDK